MNFRTRKEHVQLGDKFSFVSESLAHQLKGSKGKGKGNIKIPLREVPQPTLFLWEQWGGDVQFLFINNLSLLYY